MYKKLIILLFTLIFSFSSLSFIDSQGKSDNKDVQKILDILNENTQIDNSLIDGKYERHYSKTKYPVNYAGYYKKDNSIHILLTSKEKNIFTNLTTTNKIIFHYNAKYSLNELNETSDIVSAQISNFTQITGVGINIQENHVYIEIKKISDHELKNIEDHFSIYPAVKIISGIEHDLYEPTFIDDPKNKDCYSVIVSKDTYIYRLDDKKLIPTQKNDSLIAYGKIYKENNVKWIQVIIQNNEIGKINISFLKKNSKGNVIGKKLSETTILYNVLETTSIYELETTDSPILGNTRKNTMIPVTHVTDEYYHIMYGNKEGFVKKHALSQSKN